MPRKVQSQNAKFLLESLQFKVVTRTINRLMLDGKRGKETATILYAALISCANKPVKTMEVFEQEQSKASCRY